MGKLYPGWDLDVEKEFNVRDTLSFFTAWNGLYYGKA